MVAMYSVRNHALMSTLNSGNMRIKLPFHLSMFHINYSCIYTRIRLVTLYLPIHNMVLSINLINHHTTSVH